MDILPIGNAAHSSVARESTIPQVETAAPARPVVPATEPVAAVQQPASVPSSEQLAQAVKNINKMLQQMSRQQEQNVEFSIDSENNRTIIKVVDQSTKEVLRQIPSEEVLEIAKALSQTQGLLIRQKA